VLTRTEEKRYMTGNDSTNEHSIGSEYAKNVLTDVAEAMKEQMKEKARGSKDRSKHAITEVMQNWAQVTQTIMFTPPAPLTPTAMPNPTELVDRSFEIVEQLLAAQHTFAKKLMESVQGPTTDAATKTASAAAEADVTDAGAASTRAAANGASEATATVTETVKKAFAKN
jgi:hypothetical protein